MSDDKTKKPVQQKTVKIAPQKQEKLIYVGPNLKNGALNQYQVFVGGYPKHAEQLIKDNPKLKAMFVPIEELSSARADLQDNTSALSSIYNEILRG